MSYLRVCLLLFVMASIGLHAGPPEKIEKDSKTQKAMSLTVAHKDNPQNSNSVKVTVTFKGDEDFKVSLMNSGKNSELTTEVKDGMVSVTFEIEKDQIEKGFIRIANTGSPANCGNQFLLYLKGYIV